MTDMVRFLTVMWNRFNGWKLVSKVQEKHASLPIAGSIIMHWKINIQVCALKLNKRVNDIDYSVICRKMYARLLRKLKYVTL